MKSILITVVIGLTCMLTTQATVLIVDNSINNPGVYANIPAAIAAATAGDTIYVQGSVTPYNQGCLHNITKRLVIIGPGHRPDKQSPLRAYVTGCGPAMSFEPGSSGSVIIGLTFDATASIGINAGVDSLYISDCYFGALYMQGDGHIIEGNVFNGPNLSMQFYTGTGGSNYIIRNNIFRGNLQGFNQPNVEVINNVFLISGQAFSSVSNIMVRNNIFLKSSPLGTSGATFLNNITYLTTDTLPTPGNFGSGNINDTDPMFVNVPSTATSFSYGHDYHLQGSSPGVNAGSDGTNIGVYGGVAPFKQSGEPPIPTIREFTISNPIVPVNGTIGIRVIAETQD